MLIIPNNPNLVRIRRAGFIVTSTKQSWCSILFSLLFHLKNKSSPRLRMIWKHDCLHLDIRNPVDYFKEYSLVGKIIDPKSRDGTFLLEELLLDHFITLFRPIAVFCGTDNILLNILHIQLECEEYSINWHYCMEYSSYSCWMWGIFHIILSVPRNTAISLNNVMF